MIKKVFYKLKIVNFVFPFSMMHQKKFLLAWILSTFVMFFMSFAWHGLLLNDFKKISYSIELFLLFLGLLYLLLGFFITFGISLIGNNKNPLYTGLGIGITSGLLIFLIVFVLGSSLSGIGIQPLHATIDFIWQILEQSTGGICAAMVYSFIEKREMMFK
ncbi:MAG: hypothetical protein H0X62_00010 [Bacteroidetes bacterium]|nr:hypothetical protein [Bacteroidota bacterium]